MTCNFNFNSQQNPVFQHFFAAAIINPTPPILIILQSIGGNSFLSLQNIVIALTEEVKDERKMGRSIEDGDGDEEIYACYMS